ncbi:MAG: hypothetical protein ACOYBJ_00855 [Patescibacteria group bacterium]|jgi:diacylglycerol kinase family enzyme
MYYYISEAPRSRDEQRSLEHVRTLLTNYGIAGEFVTTSPARTIEELAELGVAKKYSTIVGVGSDMLINRLASLLAGTPYVFGALPLTNPRALELITGVTTIEEAAEALKYRRIYTVPITRIEPNKFLLTEAVIHLPRPAVARLEIDGAKIEATCTDIRIAGNGRVIIEHKDTATSTLGSVWQWMRGHVATDPAPSHFVGTHITLELDTTCPAYVGTDIIAKTPLAATVLPGVLKIIAKRGRLTQAQEQTEPAGRQQYALTNG